MQRTKTAWLISFPVLLACQGRWRDGNVTSTGLSRRDRHAATSNSHPHIPKRVGAQVSPVLGSHARGVSADFAFHESEGLRERPDRRLDAGLHAPNKIHALRIAALGGLRA